MTLIKQDIYSRCLAHHADVRNLKFVVQKSIPIPYFGDLRAFLDSKLRVLTAALNPSDREFPSGNARFDISRGLRGAAELEVELCAYFGRNPYRAWFSSFEHVLNGLGTSYGGNMADRAYFNTALHVDLCSPIATTPTWSKLIQEQRIALTPVGREIFECLVDQLEPDIVIASLGWAHIEGWHAQFKSGRSWDRLIEHRTTIAGKSLRAPLLVQSRTINSRNGRPLVFVNATAADKPFGRFSNERKRAVGQELLARLRSEK